MTSEPTSACDLMRQDRAGRGVHDVTGSGDGTALTQLVASVEPSVVFTSLAAQSVPALCDSCTIDIVDGGLARYRVVFPPCTTSVGGLLRLADRPGGAPDHWVRVPFAHPIPARTVRNQHPEAGSRDEFRGAATFVWRRRVPTRSDEIAAGVLVDRAVQTVVRQRREQAAGAVTHGIGAQAVGCTRDDESPS